MPDDRGVLISRIREVLDNTITDVIGKQDYTEAMSAINRLAVQKPRVPMEMLIDVSERINNPWNTKPYEPDVRKIADRYGYEVSE
jgi:hypothetical protein